MKIAEIIATFPPYHGGMGYLCYHNSVELAKRGHDVTVFTLDHGSLNYDNDPKEIEIVRLKTPLIYGDGGVIPQLYCQLKEFDIIHLHYPFFGGAEYVYFASLLRGQKYLLTYHMDVYGNTLFKKIVIGIYEPLLMKKIVCGAAGICAPGINYLKSTKVGGAIDYRKIVDVKHGGVDVDKFQPREKNSALLDEYNLRNKVVALFVGNLQPFKALHLLIDAISMINDDNLVLLVVGGGYGEEKYRTQVEEKGLKNRVIFAGPKSPDEDLPEYYNLGDFLVLPSTHSESFGLVILEAMSSGIPAIVSNLPGPSQLIDDGKDGFTVNVGEVGDLKNKIEHLTRNAEIRNIMGSCARNKVVKNYSWDQVGRGLEKVIQDIVNN